MSDVFISYTRKDRDRVESLADLLREAGLDVWWDRDLLAGSHWDEAIEEQIKAAKCVVVVWSKESVQRKWVRAEADLASSRDVLVPVLFEDVEPPLAFRMVQAANLTGWQPGLPHPGIEDLLKAIAQSSGQPSKAVPPARRREPRTEKAIPGGGGEAGSRAAKHQERKARAPRASDVGIDKAAGSPKFPDRVEVRWDLALPGEVHEAPIVASDGAIHVISRNGALVCMDAGGALRWSAIIGGGRGIGGQGITPSASGDVLAVTDGYMHCLTAEGKNRWKWTNRGGVTAAPAVAPDGTVYAMTNQSALWALSRDGEELWNRKLCQVSGGGSWPSPAFSGDIVYAACRGRSVYGVQADTGDLAWSFDVNDAVSASPVVGSDGTGYFASDAGWVFAIDPSGAQRWVASVSGGSGKIARIDAPLTIADDDTVLVAPRHGKIGAIAPTGDVRWEAALGGQGTGDRPVAAAPDGRVYAATTGRELVGLSADGQEFMRMSSDGWVSAPGIGPDNVLYVGMGTRLYALEVSLGPKTL